VRKVEATLYYLRWLGANAEVEASGTAQDLSVRAVADATIAQTEAGKGREEAAAAVPPLRDVEAPPPPPLPPLPLPPPTALSSPPWLAPTADVEPAGTAQDLGARAAADATTAQTEAGKGREEAAAAVPPLRDVEARAAAALQRLLIARDTLDAEEKRARER